MQRYTYDSIIQGAESGDPVKMLELAKLYQAGAFGDSDYSEYVYWLEQFFNNEKVMAITSELEERYGNNDVDGNSPHSPCFDLESFSIEEYEILRGAIVEAGLSLGIYYRYSSEKDKLELAMQSLSAALDASGWDYLVSNEPNGAQESILTILNKISDRYNELGFNEGEKDE